MISSERDAHSQISRFRRSGNSCSAADGNLSHACAATNVPQRQPSTPLTNARRNPRMLAPRESTGVLEYTRISIGEVAASLQPIMLQTLLGSCVAVCLRDPESGAGGMNHILLPGSATEAHASRFGVQAMELLINQLMKLGADRRKFAAKAFGAGNVLPSMQRPTIGDRNAQFVRSFLAAEGIPLLAERLGGNQAVQVRFNTGTGKAVVRSVDGSRLPSIIVDEDDYRGRTSVKAINHEDVTLF